MAAAMVQRGAQRMLSAMAMAELVTSPARIMLQDISSKSGNAS
jgi:hypothetical protein